MRYLLPLLFLLACTLALTGCVTMAREIYIDVSATPTTPAPTPTPQPTPIPIVRITPTPTPTPDLGDLFIKSGGLNMSEWFTFTRRSFRDTITAHVMVYRYQVRSFYHLDSPDQDVFNTPVLPKPGKRFLFIWVRAISDSSTPLGGYDYSCFWIEYRGQAIRPTLQTDFIYELATYAGKDKKEKTKPYGYFYGRDMEINKNNLTIKNRRFIQEERFIPGDSNSWDGYILFQIPRGATIQDLTVHADFEGMFHPKWRFVGGDVFSLAYPPIPVRGA